MWNLKHVRNNCLTPQNEFVLENLTVAELSNISPHLTELGFIYHAQKYPQLILTLDQRN